MPVPGPANVIWHSSPGDCRFSFEHIYSTGGEDDNPTFTLTVPPLPEATPSTALFVLLSATNGWLSDGARNLAFTDSLGNSLPSIAFWSGGASGSPWPGSTGGGFSGIGAAQFVAFPNIGVGGGIFSFTASSSHLDFISGILFRSANGVAIACAVDIGDPRALVTYAGVGADGTPATAVQLHQSGNSNTPTVTVVDPIGRSLIIGAATTLGHNTITSVGSGWSEVVTDYQVITQSGGGGGSWPPTTVSLAVYDALTDPPNLTEQWSIASTAETWMTSAGTLWVSLAGAGRAGGPQVIG